MNRTKTLEKLFAQTKTQDLIGMWYSINQVFLTKRNEPTDNKEISYVGLNESVIDQCNNVFDEVVELEAAIDEIDRKETLDAIADIMAFGYGALYILNPSDAHALVNNYTRKIDDVHVYAETHESVFLGMMASLQVLKSMFESNNTVGNIIEALLFAEEWAHILKIRLHDLMVAVTNSSYTKLMFDDAELEATTKQYRDLGVAELYNRSSTLEVDGDTVKYYVIYSGADQLDVNGKQYRANKFLKSINFQDPSLLTDFNVLW